MDYPENCTFFIGCAWTALCAVFYGSSLAIFVVPAVALLIWLVAEATS